MVHTFATGEEAAIFASSRRSDGYFAEILDEGMGAIYGPLAIGGIRVVVSDEPLEETGDGADAPPPGHAEDGEFLRLVRMLVVGLAAIGLVVIAIGLISIIPRDPVELARALYRMLRLPVLVALIFVLLGPLMGGFTQWLRGEQVTAETGWARWLLIGLLSFFIIMATL